MKRFCIACVGFSLLCLALSCGQQAFKRDSQAAQVSSGTLFVHATPVGFGPKGVVRIDEANGLLNLSHVTFIGKMQGADNIAVVPHTYSHSGVSGVGDSDFYQIDAADVPK
jgi:hypothetical protein